MKYVSVCSGIEAASVAWEPLGFEPLLFAEIEKFPSAVLAQRFPHVRNVGDFTLIGDELNGSVDILVGGTPCQSFSIAGLRGGMADSRGNLALEFLRLADRLKPTWILWENVLGVLSSASHDAPDEVPPGDDLEPGQRRDVVEEYEADETSDFGCFLSGIQELGYGFAWASLNAQYFDLAQRRERVFVVAHIRDARLAQAVLFDRTGLFGHPAPSREAGQSTTHDIAPSITGSGRGTERTGDTRGQDPVIACEWPADVAPTLNAHFGEKLGLEDQHIRGGAGLFVNGRSQPLPQCRRDGTAGLRDGNSHHDGGFPDSPTHKLAG